MMSTAALLTRHSLPALCSLRRPLSTSVGSAISQNLAQRCEDLPLKEAIAFKVNNVKWSYQDLKEHSDALAAGLLELGWRSGDVLAVWVESDCQEQIVTRFASSRAGLGLVEIDAGVSDPESLRKILNETNAKGLVFDPVMGDRYNQDIVEAALPELASFDDRFGGRFRSRAVPSIGLVAHTGMDLVPGVVNLKHLLAYDAPESRFNSTTSGMKQVVSYGSGGGATSLKEDEALQSAPWNLVSGILRQERQLSEK